MAKRHQVQIFYDNFVFHISCNIVNFLTKALLVLLFTLVRVRNINKIDFKRKIKFWFVLVYTLIRFKAKKKSCCQFIGT